MVLLNLYELQKELKKLYVFVEFWNAKIENRKEKLGLPKTTKITEQFIKSYGNGNDIVDELYQIMEWEQKRDRLLEEINEYTPLINDLEKILKEFNDRDQLIYLQYHLRGYSLINISVRHGLDKSTVWRILKKVEKKLTNATLCNTR